MLDDLFDDIMDAWLNANEWDSKAFHAGLRADVLIMSGSWKWIGAWS
jgi:hypothetical protein